MMTATGLRPSRHLPSQELPGANPSRTEGFGFTRRFFLLLTLGLLPIMLSWIDSRLVWLTAAYNVALIGAAALDLWRCEGADDITLRRIFDPPVCLGFSNRVAIRVSNLTERRLRLRLRSGAH